jgi:broad specificity phosphatase PhoE
MTIARHAETVYNAAARMQGHMAHTPLTRNGIAQAEAMGAALAAHFGQRPDIDIWASPSGRTLQTAAIVVEQLGVGFFEVRTDARLLEIDVGDWEGRLYSEIVAEWFPAIAARLQAWLADLAPDRDVLVISHGITLRVLRGLLAGGAEYEGVALADDAPQGTIFVIEDGVQSILHTGAGTIGVRAA